jgi:zinc transporter ZupT
LIIYVLATPIGISIGLGLGAVNQLTKLFSGIFVSLAAGSFLYIGLIEIIPAELNSRHLLKWKLLFLWLSFAIMQSIAILTAGQD